MQAALRRLAVRLDWPIGLLALLVVVFEDRTDFPQLQQVAILFNWLVWGAFCLQFLLAFAGEPRWTTVRKRWFDLLLIAVSPPFLVPNYLQATRSLRLVRLMRIGVVAGLGFRLTRQLLAHRRFHFVALVAIGVTFLGAFGIFLLEGETNPSVRSFGDALWWAIVTATTVGYGDVSPATGAGRMIAVVLMVTGISVIGVFTATLASFFFAQDEDPALALLSSRLDAIEQKLDLLLTRNDERQLGPPSLTGRLPPRQSPDEFIEESKVE